MTRSPLRSLSLLALLTLAAAGPTACASADAQGDEEVDVDSSDITVVDHTKVKRQSIGNCWVYAVAGWAESLNERATGTEMNISESYITYWHWFEQLTNGRASTEISTGGSFGVATDLITRYGIVTEGNFIPAEQESEMSNTQKSALDAINLSMKSGVLKDPAARRDRKLVRAELDRAFGLSTAVKAKLDKVFGVSVNKTLDRAYASKKTGTDILRAKDVPVSVPDATTHVAKKVTLADAIGTGSWLYGRTGTYAFQEVDYPSNASSRRALQVRIQRAMHDGAPVVLSWAVDFNALTRDSKFSKVELDRRGPGRQGGHMTVFSDYQARLADGTLLEAGKTYDKTKLEAALRTDTKIEFFRIKNSWGALRSDRWDIGNGYHDMMIDYLNGPIKKCVEVNGTSDPNNCPTTQTPLWDVVLPAGY
ncbi:MAG: hypothetical protein U0174_04385 [Polyangiaceae bacterium]